MSRCGGESVPGNPARKEAESLRTTHAIALSVLVATSVACSQTPSNKIRSDFLLLSAMNMKSGIPRVAEIGMRRQDVEAILGKPLIPGVDVIEFGHRGPNDDPDPRTDSFYDGAYVWIDYDAKDRVSSIEYNLADNRGITGRKQRLLLFDDTKSIVVSDDTSMSSLEKELERQGQSVDISETMMRVKGSGLAFISEGGLIRRICLAPEKLKP
jgi:hypothetical protein